MCVHYVKPESQILEDNLQGCLCATSERDGSLQDYNEDTEYNFFG